MALSSIELENGKPQNHFPGMFNSNLTSNHHLSNYDDPLFEKTFNWTYKQISNPMFKNVHNNIVKCVVDVI